MLTIVGALTSVVGVGILLLIIVGIWWLVDAFLIPGILEQHKADVRRKLTEHALMGRRNVFFDASVGFVDTPIYNLTLLRPGIEVTGPAVIESAVTTIVVNPGDRANLDGYRNVRLSIGH